MVWWIFRLLKYKMLHRRNSLCNCLCVHTWSQWLNAIVWERVQWWSYIVRLGDMIILKQQLSMYCVSMDCQSMNRLTRASSFQLNNLLEFFQFISNKSNANTVPPWKITQDVAILLPVEIACSVQKGHPKSSLPLKMRCRGIKVWFKTTEQIFFLKLINVISSTAKP